MILGALWGSPVHLSQVSTNDTLAPAAAYCHISRCRISEALLRVVPPPPAPVRVHGVFTSRPRARVTHVLWGGCHRGDTSPGHWPGSKSQPHVFWAWKAPSLPESRFPPPELETMETPAPWAFSGLRRPRV